MRIECKRLAILSWLAGLCAAAAAQFHPVDLSADIHRQWGTFQPFSDWTFPAGGRQTFNSVPFDISGVVQLVGMEHAGKGNVRAVRKSFAVNRAFTQLHLLHYTEFSSSYGQPVAMLWLHYDDGGQSYSFPLRFGVHCMDGTTILSSLRPAAGRRPACGWRRQPPREAVRSRAFGTQPFRTRTRPAL